METDELPVMTVAAAPVRDRYNAFIARHDTAWELGMAAFAVVYVALGFLLD